MIRTATSPRFAMSTRRIIRSASGTLSAQTARHTRVFAGYAETGGWSAVGPGDKSRSDLSSDGVQRKRAEGLQLEEEIAVLDRLLVLHGDPPDAALVLGLDLVHQLHRLEDAQRLPRLDRIADLDERRRP